MTTRRFGRGIALCLSSLAVLPLAACSSGASSSAGVSDACAEAMETMGKAYDELGDFTNDQADEANALELGPLNACATADEWVAAARANPAALGWDSADAIDPALDLGIRCSESDETARATPVCQDAITTGLVD